MNQEAMDRPFVATIRHLAARWQGADVLLPAFPLLAKGKPLSIGDVAEATGVSAARVEQAVESGRCERDSEGRLIDLYGMTLTPSLHRIEVDSRIVYSCCALWTHVIPKLLGQRVQIESVDPVRRRVVRLSVGPQGIATLEPADSAATLVVASEEEIGQDVCAAFCCQVRHFVSHDSAEEFAARSSSCYAVDLSELQTEADRLYRAIWWVVHSK